MQNDHTPVVIKPTVQIKDAAIITGWDGKNRLTGVVIDYPDSHQSFEGAVENDKPVITSEIIKSGETYVETKRTMYYVLNWVG
jgi:hypothetical protein